MAPLHTCDVTCADNQHGKCLLIPVVYLLIQSLAIMLLTGRVCYLPYKPYHFTHVSKGSALTDI